ncbi:MAG: TraR/DksA C4-type zinc finger protein [Acidimicrobiia bacterium]|nr:TraR/DksA C4-type zinc finger protein [Acidimicrobiia bacterium]
MAELTHAALRAQLTEERDRVRDQLQQMGYGPNGGLDFDEGFADSGQVTAERGEVEALAGSLLDTLAEIERALAKFDAGTYGRCDSCGEEIATARLEAMPAARYCIACASKRR